MGSGGVATGEQLGWLPRDAWGRYVLSPNFSSVADQGGCWEHVAVGSVKYCCVDPIAPNRTTCGTRPIGWVVLCQVMCGSSMHGRCNGKHERCRSGYDRSICISCNLLSTCSGARSLTCSAKRSSKLRGSCSFVHSVVCKDGTRPRCCCSFIVVVPAALERAREGTKTKKENIKNS